MESYYLGLELGSTRIKSVLINSKGKLFASGSHTWNNNLVNNLWTYGEDEIVSGVSQSVNNLFKDFGGVPELSAIGVSGMMHGYIALDKDGNLLTPFRTWRNTNTAEAADALTNLFGVNIPMRWSVAHLYQAILNGEEHVKDIAHITTVAGYVQYKLTGKFVVGIGEASGMFPVTECGYNKEMLAKFDELVKDRAYPWKMEDILPEVLPAGKVAGVVAKEGASYFNIPLKAGTRMCPPEGDAGTGMAATNSVKPKTGNVSAGTSVFSMVVLDKPLKNLHTEIDVVATPDGKPVAMVHCNNCTSDINAWIDFIKQTMEQFGCKIDAAALTEGLFNLSQNADEDLGGLMNYNYLSGEPVT
ncbi:MAG: ATPase, partial [Clostridia bacterium]|nr:ATPase [Clostridia bacterium]